MYHLQFGKQIEFQREMTLWENREPGLMLWPKSATATFIKIQRRFWWSIAYLSCLAWDYETMREKTANGGRPLGPIPNAHGGSLAVRLEFHSFLFMTLISCTREFFARINKQRTREKVREWYAERVRQGYHREVGSWTWRSRAYQRTDLRSGFQ